MTRNTKAPATGGEFYPVHSAAIKIGHTPARVLKTIEHLGLKPERTINGLPHYSLAQVGAVSRHIVLTIDSDRE